MTPAERMREAMNALARAGFDIQQLAAQGYVSPEAARAYDPGAAMAPTQREIETARDDAADDERELLSAMYGRKDPKDEKIAHEVERSRAQAERERVALEADRIAAQREQVSLLRDLAKLAAEQKAAAAQDDVAESIDVPAGTVPPFDVLTLRGLPAPRRRR
jgi:hypothetical protein